MCTYLKILIQYNSEIFLLGIFAKQIGGNDETYLHSKLFLSAVAILSNYRQYNYSDMGQRLNNDGIII